MESLSGKTVRLPDALEGRPAVLVVGFSQRSQGQTAAWSRQLAKDYGSEPELRRFSIAVLDDVPSFVRGFVVAGIRRAVPAEEHATSLVLARDARPWRTLTALSSPYEAYVILVDRGEVVAQTHGAPESAYGPFQTAIRHVLDRNRDAAGADKR
jgi:hypothetical protein